MVFIHTKVERGIFLEAKYNTGPKIHNSNLINQADFLIKRLEAIGVSLKNTEGALALLGLGSVGLERDRLDEFSDLDFFVIVQPGFKARFIETLDWLFCIGQVDYFFRNTIDGYKLLFTDGVFCEFAVFEPQELDGIPFAPGVIVWRQEGVPDSIAVSKHVRLKDADRNEAWLIGEALTCLYAGLNRLRRGELLSAQRFIQHFAVDRLLELISMKPSAGVSVDTFAIERRFELLFPGSETVLGNCIQGYVHSAESALALLGYLEADFDINPALAQRIRTLAQEHVF
jgi:hypothetical protein